MIKTYFNPLCIFALAIGFWSVNIQAAAPKISIITSGIGHKDSNFPSELASFWEPLSVSGQTILQSIVLKNIDYSQKKLTDFAPPGLEQGIFDKFLDGFKVQSEENEQKSQLKKIASALKNQEYKIPDQYANSTSQATPEQKEWMRGKIEELKKNLSPSNVIYFNHTGNSDQSRRIFTKAKDVREYIQKKLSEASVDQSDEAALTYLVIYQSGEKAIADSSSTSVPAVEVDGKTLSEEPNVIHSDPESVKTIEGKNVCNEQLLLQGIQFVSMAKAKPTQALKKSDLNNAFQLFDNAVRESDVAGGCCTKALMNRGVARDLLREPDLAILDLKAAEQCDSQNMEVHYNLACHYSKHSTISNSQLGSALQELEKAVEAGFKDCDQILNDPDLANLRRDSDFKDKLRKMLQQHGQFCIVNVTPKK